MSLITKLLLAIYFLYIMAAEGGGNIIWFTYTGTDGEVIDDEATHVIVDKNCTVVRAYAFRNHPSIVEVICHENVEKIEQEAFLWCPSLRRVVMRGVKVVEGSAFHCCEALTDVECDKLEIIKEYALSWCTSLKSINLPSARIVERTAICRCYALKDVKFGSKLERIDVEAFWLCSSLERIAIPLKDGLFNHDDIFQGCDDLLQVDLIEGKLHKIIAALHLEEWRNDMNQEVDSINQILLSASAGRYVDGYDEEGDPGEKARALRRWIRSVIQRLIHYKAEHRKLLKEATTLLELALWKANLADNNGGKGEREGV